MGAVYKAEHRLMERPVALKVINRDLIDNPALVERFRREVQAAARLDRIPTSSPPTTPSRPATAFPGHGVRRRGQTWPRLLDEEGPLPVAEACDYIRQAALGLQHAHEHGMVHRDIKPHNLMLTPGRPGQDPRLRPGPAGQRAASPGRADR